MRMTTSDELARMMGRFRGNVDFTDSPSGFFGFVRETFEQLAKEEEYAADYEDIDIPSYPTFGHKDDTYEDVVRDFYSAWNGFATAKSFAWVDVYRLSEAPDRRYRRAMEKENQKLRDDARRDFNDAVRALVAFVRKRDPRYTPNTQSADEKAKAQRDARKAQAARARAAQLAKLEQEAQALPSWATARPADEEEEETEDEIEEDHYECVACNKTFKSERQWEAHEKSKKHQKAIQALQRKMQKENAHLNLDEDGLDSGVITAADDSLDADLTGSDTNGMEDSVQDITDKTDELEIGEEGTDSEDLDDHSVASGPRTAQVDTPEDNEDSENDDDEYASRSDIEARLNGLASTNASIADTETTATEYTVLDDPPAKSEDSSAQVPKLGKAAQKRVKRAAKQAEGQSEDGSATNTCLGCDAAFPSKTRLHQHLQDNPKHAALKSAPSAKGKKKGKR
jgi:DnaJ family protein A protein 5